MPLRRQKKPLRERPAQDYKSGGRQFGAQRSGGGRKHAGCDLKAPPGTEILAMADGEILRGPASFYDNTFALEIRHENGMVVRYGEIQARIPKGIRGGAKVLRGQVIAFVGQLSSGNSMLHLEMYSGTAEGPLSQTGNPFKRRADLIDPTDYLDRAPLLVSGAATQERETIPLEEESRAPEAREHTPWELALKDAPTTGASDITAGEDQLSGGIDASHTMAEADWPRVEKLIARFQTAGSKFGIPGAILAALASRESRCGASAILDEKGWDHDRRTFGILKIDRKCHELEGLDEPASLEHIEQAADIFCGKLERVAEKHPDWEPPFVLKGAVVAYDAGLDMVRSKEEMDIGTSNNDYGSDVIARAQYYYGKEGLWLRPS